jgi:ATP-binding cassette, subfamily B, bacterial
MTPNRKPPAAAGLLKLLKPYSGLVAVLVLMTILGNGLNLTVPMLLSHAIDTYTHGDFVMRTVVLRFAAVALLIFLFTYLQSIAQTVASEKVAKDLRAQLVAKISVQSYGFIEKVTPAKLLTNLTSDVDAVKLFVSQAVASIVSSVFLIVGATALLLSINWRLGLSILGIIPIIGLSLYIALSKVRKLFKKAQEAVDWLNRVINESISSPLP